MVPPLNKHADMKKARREIRVTLRGKLNRAVQIHNEVLKGAVISSDFASVTATVAGEQLVHSALDIVFDSIIRDIAVANRLRIFAHQIEKVDVHYVDHQSGETIAKTSRNLEKIFLAN
jgi:hypothetical protein